MLKHIICDVLGLSKPGRVVQCLDTDEASKVDLNAELGPYYNKPVNPVNESRLYKIVLRVDKLKEAIGVCRAVSST